MKNNSLYVKIFFFGFVLFLMFAFYYYYYFFFLIIQSQAAFVNCLYVARFTIVHSKTQIKFPLLLFHSRCQFLFLD